MQPFKQTVVKDFASLREALGDISRKRQEDITDRNNFNSIFVNGRKVGKVPSGSADVVASDRIGDFNVDNTYAYWLVDDGAGGAEWVRAGVSTW